MFYGIITSSFLTVPIIILLVIFMPKKKHGGKRINAGRPKLNPSEKKEPTKLMRIPLSKVAAVLATIGKA